MAKKIKMFKPGKHVAMNGQAIEFSEADLAASARAYDPELHAAPLVIGHPRHDAPAYGRVAAVEFAEGFLLGEPAKVDPKFAEAVNAGHFDRVSLSFYAPDSPANPVPGVYYPRHLGFLGALPPGVKGLGPVEFGEGEEGVVCFGDWNDQTIARLFRKLKNFLIGTYGKETADQVIDEWELEDIQREALRPETPAEPVPPAFAEPPARKEPSMTEEELKAWEDKLKAQAAEQQRTAAAAVHAANLAFAEGLVKEGKLLPAQRPKVVAVLDFASSLEGENTIEFGEGEARTTEPIAATLRGILTSYPQLIEFGELGGGKEPEAGKEEAVPVLTDRV